MGARRGGGGGGGSGRLCARRKFWAERALGESIGQAGAPCYPDLC